MTDNTDTDDDRVRITDIWIDGSGDELEQGEWMGLFDGAVEGTLTATFYVECEADTDEER